MGIFGWSYPPGCSGPPDDDEGPCECCGMAVDVCVCPECTVCHVHGDYRCYAFGAHEMVYTDDQIVGLGALEKLHDEQAARDRAEGDYWSDPQRKVEEAEFAALMETERKQREQ